MKWILALMTAVFTLTLIALGMSLEEGVRQRAALDEAAYQLRLAAKERGELENSRKLLQDDLTNAILQKEQERLRWAREMTLLAERRALTEGETLAVEQPERPAPNKEPRLPLKYAPICAE